MRAPGGRQRDAVRAGTERLFNVPALLLAHARRRPRVPPAVGRHKCRACNLMFQWGVGTYATLGRTCRPAHGGGSQQESTGGGGGGDSGGRAFKLALVTESHVPRVGRDDANSTDNPRRRPEQQRCGRALLGLAWRECGAARAADPCGAHRSARCRRIHSWHLWLIADRGIQTRHNASACAAQIWSRYAHLRPSVASSLERMPTLRHLEKKLAEQTLAMLRRPTSTGGDHYNPSIFSPVPGPARNVLRELIAYERSRRVARARRGEPRAQVRDAALLAP